MLKPFCYKCQQSKKTLLDVLLNKVAIRYYEIPLLCVHCYFVTNIFDINCSVLFSYDFIKNTS